MLKSTKRIIVAGLMSCATLTAFGNGMANAYVGSWGGGPSILGYPGSMISSYGMGVGMGGPNYYGFMPGPGFIF
ncbi:hypothetical protein [Pasteuria penetrans]|uniref:hypothetical protein n=1 Tax=Pasteuria penetrans TaxID=86005 RepID=UPI000FAF914B|nr:hypothetical protein [Pasteuria penetrans]